MWQQCHPQRASLRADAFAAWVGAVVGISAGIFTLLVVMPLLKRNIDKAEARATKCEYLSHPSARSYCLVLQECLHCPVSGTRALGFSFSTILRVAVLDSWSLGYCAALCVKAGDSHLGDSGVSQNPALFAPVLCCDVSAKPASLKLSCRQHLQSWAKI